ncbi:rodlin [Streptomyces sp. NPDC001795]|uniref:rodlin n=1 Tax=unclassified Streptomyces TaxID=2593676 RepID=UPI00331EB5B9
MFKKAMAVAAVAASVVGASAAAAPQALALGDDTGTTSTSGTSAQTYGNQATQGAMSPQLSLVQGSANKACVGLPAKANATSLAGLVPVGVQDIPVLSAAPNQQCTENSTQAKGDEPLSHVVDNIPVLSGNGTSS